MRKEFEDLTRRIDGIREKLAPLLPKLAAARNAYYSGPSSLNEKQLDAIQSEVSALSEAMSLLVAELPRASGLPPEMFQGSELEDDRPAGPPEHMSRENLTADRIETTAYIDELLPDALEWFMSLLPNGWLQEQPREASRIGSLLLPDAILSLTRNSRVDGGHGVQHRLRQALSLGQDYLENHPLYDHFAGAALLPTMVKLAIQRHHLARVGGGREERIRHLWHGPSAEVDGTMFELLTAAACVEMGRGVEFLSTSDKKTPDMRCHDPFPIVIECKRQETISSYEASEEAHMRSLFATMRRDARKIGLSGTFKLTLSVDASLVDIADVSAKLLMQRLAAHPEQALAYDWGSVSLEPLPSKVDLPSSTRLYSPNMLEHLFDWSTDLPDWDGICCSVDLRGQPLTDTVRSPVALLWRNTSPDALRKRTWAPTNLFGAATLQVPSGEFGIVYVNYVEGARAEVADRRLQAFTKRLQEFEHSARVRVPIAVLSRLYPRPLNEGQPDLIESSVQYVSGLYGEPLLFKSFPTTVFTASG